jgi:hypothetical protein
MSSSVGYDYSYIDIEAQRRRVLRAEIAELRHQLAAVRSQAAGLQRFGRRVVGRGDVAAVGLDATSQQLDVVAGALRAAIASARDEVDHARTEFWEDRVGAALKADPSTRPATGTATEELAQQRAAAPAAAVPLQTAAELEAVVGQAEGLLVAEGHRCDPADLELLQRLLTELRTLDRLAAVQQQAFEIRAVVTESIKRRERDHEVATVRARLLTLVEEALPDDRERLRALVTTASDPGGLTGQVAQAIERADKVRNRRAVAQATAEALGEIGCEVGESFVTLLAERGETVAAFDQTWPGYGLLVRLPEQQTKLLAAVVRRADVPSSPARDLQVQEGFCADQLEEVVGRLRKRIGISPTPFVRLAPGQRPVAAVGPERWPTARPDPAVDTARTDQRTRTRPARLRPAPRAKERQREQ